MIFLGTHEVRVKTPAGILAGYFDNEASAVSAVERLPAYTAAWASLNPLRPDALTPDTAINPMDLLRTSSAAADSHILRCEWLPLDFVLPRPANTNAADEENAAARQQMEQCHARAFDAERMEGVLEKHSDTIQQHGTYAMRATNK